MYRRLIFAAIAMAGAGEGARLPRQIRKPAPPTGARAVACPRCKAGAGEGCDQRTLGRHTFHKARVDAAHGGEDE